MDHQDHYRILGVPKTATPEEIKKAYRQLALKYHPDRNSDGNAGKTEDKFKEVNEAYQVLRNPVKRKKYDQFGEDWQRYEQSETANPGFEGTKYSRHDGGRGTASDIGDAFQDADSQDIFSSLFGRRTGEQASRRTSPRKGVDLEAETNVELMEAYKGTARTIELSGQTIRVRIKPGIADGQILRLAGKGGSGKNGGSNGDLYITIHVAAHPDYQRRGNDLYRDADVDLYAAVLGGKPTVSTLKGMVKVTVPRESDNGKVLRLPGLGMPVYNESNNYGDLYVRLKVELPKQLTETEHDLFKKLADMRSNHQEL